MKQLSFNTRLFIKIGFCFSALTLVTFSSLGYDENRERYASSNTNQGSLYSLREAWEAIERSSKKLGDEISSNSISSLREIQRDLNRGLTYLETNSVRITTNNTARFKTSIEEALESSKNIYHETDKKLSRTASKEYKKLKNALESIKTQMPTNIFSHSNQVMSAETNRFNP